MSFKSTFVWLLPGLVLLAACSAPLVSEPGTPCAYQGWSEPVALGDSTEALVGVSLTVRDSVRYVAGTAHRFLRPDKQSRYLIRPLGQDPLYADFPPTPMSYQAIPAVDSKETVHLVWREESGDAAGSAMQLFHNQYHAGRWSEPELVHAYSPGFAWKEYGSDPMIIDDEDNLHLVVTHFPNAEGDGTIHYVRGDRHGWKAFDTGIEAGEPFLAVAPSGDLYLTFVAAKLPENAKQGDHDENSVFFTVSKDQGQTWAEPVLVSRSGDFAGQNPKLYVTSSEIHLLWTKEHDKEGRVYVLWHARSADGGKAWSEPQEIGTEMPGHITMAQAAATPDGCLHLVFERETHMVALDQQLHYAQWDGQRWTTPAQLFPESYSFEFALAGSADGTLHLTWMQRPSVNWPGPSPTPGPGEWPRQMYSTNRPR